VKYERLSRVKYEELGRVKYERLSRVDYEELGRVVFEELGRVDSDFFLLLFSPSCALSCLRTLFFFLMDLFQYTYTFF